MGTRLILVIEDEVPLDEDGTVLIRSREVRVCDGCHEPLTDQPYARRTRALPGWRTRSELLEFCSRKCMTTHF
jgi:hypothetical protein